MLGDIPLFYREQPVLGVLLYVGHEGEGLEVVLLLLRCR